MALLRTRLMRARAPTRSARQRLPPGVHGGTSARRPSAADARRAAPPRARAGVPSGRAFRRPAAQGLLRQARAARRGKHAHARARLPSCPPEQSARAQVDGRAEEKVCNGWVGAVARTRFRAGRGRRLRMRSTRATDRARHTSRLSRLCSGLETSSLCRTMGAHGVETTEVRLRHPHRPRRHARRRASRHPRAKAAREPPSHPTAPCRAPAARPIHLNAPIWIAPTLSG